MSADWLRSAGANALRTGSRKEDRQGRRVGSMSFLEVLLGPDLGMERGQEASRIGLGPQGYSEGAVSSLLGSPWLESGLRGGSATPLSIQVTDREP